jgi:16S rRNA (uracil1498-N3)-methyltransferase
MPYFYHPNPDEGYFDEEESKHIAKVLRHRQGQELDLIDGKGGLYKIRLTSTSFDRVEFTVLESSLIKRSVPEIQVLVGVLKSDERMEWMVEKLTEIGVSQIHLCQMARSEGKFPKSQRLQKILISSLKQSRQYWLPKLYYHQSIGEFLDMTRSAHGLKLIAHLMSEYPTHSLLDIKNDNAIVDDFIKLIIGPEGDLSRDEAILAFNQGFQSVTFGKNVLRTETAAIYGASLCNALWAEHPSSAKTVRTDRL